MPPCLAPSRQEVCEKMTNRLGRSPSVDLLGVGAWMMEGHLLAGLCSDCVINERSLCWRLCGTEESQRPKHHKGEKNEVRLLPGSKIQPRVTLLLHGSRPKRALLGVVLSPNCRRKVMRVCEEVKPCDCQQNRTSTNLAGDAWVFGSGPRHYS